jgi:hypothetical protein
MEFFDVEFTRDGDISFRALEGLMPEGLEIIASAGPFDRAGGKLPEETVLEYEVDPAPLACLEKPADEENLSDGDDVWYRLGGDSGGDPSAEAAGILHERWSSLLSEGGDITDRRGRTRSTRGCSVSRGEGADTLTLRIEAGPESAPGPADLLRAVMPEEAAALAVVTRKGIYYRQGDALLEPLDLITGNI